MRVIYVSKTEVMIGQTFKPNVEAALSAGSKSDVNWHIVRRIAARDLGDPYLESLSLG